MHYEPGLDQPGHEPDRANAAGSIETQQRATGNRTPLVFAPVKAASARGVHPAASAAVTAGASLAR